MKISIKVYLHSRAESEHTITTVLRSRVYLLPIGSTKVDIMMKIIGMIVSGDVIMNEVLSFTPSEQEVSIVMV